MFYNTAFDNKKAFLRKYFIFIALFAITILSFASCGKTETGESAETETETLSEHVTETETAEIGTNTAQNPSGFTVENGKTAVFNVTGCGAVPSSFDEFVKSAVNGDETVANVTELQIGDAKISVRIGGEEICAFSVSYHGQTAYFYKPLSLYGNLNVQAFEYDGRFVFSSTSFGTDPILSAEKTETAGERYDIDECFEYYKSIGGECETPEELFEKNKEKAAKK